MNLKEVFDEKFYNDLIKCDFVKDIEEMLSLPQMINIDISDFKDISNGEVVGSISQYINDVNKEELVVKTINDKQPNNCIVNIGGRIDLSLNEANSLVDKIRNKYKGLNIIFGCYVNDELEAKYKIQALLTYSNK